MRLKVSRRRLGRGDRGIAATGQAETDAPAMRPCSPKEWTLLDKYLRPVGTAVVTAFLLGACTSVEQVYKIYALTGPSQELTVGQKLHRGYEGRRCATVLRTGCIDLQRDSRYEGDVVLIKIGAESLVQVKG